MERNKGGAIVVNYLLTMELTINAYAIVEADNEEDEKRRAPI